MVSSKYVRLQYILEETWWFPVFWAGSLERLQTSIVLAMLCTHTFRPRHSEETCVEKGNLQKRMPQFQGFRQTPSPVLVVQEEQYAAEHDVLLISEEPVSVTI